MSVNLNQNLISALLQARQQQQKVAPEQFPITDVAESYAMQQAMMQQYAQQVKSDQSGWKIALTGAMAQQKYGIYQPVYGRLLKSMCLENASTIQLKADDAIKLEVELTFVLSQDLVPEEQYSDDVLLQSIAEVIPALEIVNVRWQHWNFNLAQFLADNAAASAYVLGQPIAYDFKDEHCLNIIESSNFETVLSVNEQDNPARNFIWLVRSLLSQGLSLKAGQQILTGSLIRPVAVCAGEYRINIAGQVLTVFATTENI